MRVALVMIMLLVGCGAPPKARPTTTVVLDSTNPQDGSPGTDESGEAESDAAEPASRPKGAGGRMDPAVIRRVVHRHTDVFRRCYEVRLAKDPRFTTRIDVRFVIAPNGEVSDAEARPTRINGTAPEGEATAYGLAKDVAACLAKAFRKLTFPRPQGGIVTVNYPIIFSADSGDKQAPPKTAAPGKAPPSPPPPGH